MKKLIISALLLASPVMADDKISTNITIYSKSSGGYNSHSANGYGIVRQVREVDLPYKRSFVTVDDVASTIKATTVMVKSLTDKNAKILEQDYRYDLASLEKMARHFIGQDIRYTVKDTGIFDGKLISSFGKQLLVQDKSGEILSTDINNVHFPQLPKNFYMKPTLVWDIYSNQIGTHKLEYSYEASNISWWADYNASYSDGKTANDGYLDLSSWVTIVNQTGAKFEDAKLKLVAGDVNKVQPQYNHRAMGKAMYMEADVASAPAGFEEKSLFEYHMYTLGRPVTIVDSSSKQIELMPAVHKIPVKKEYVYNGNSTYYYGGYNSNKSYGTSSNKDVAVQLVIANSKENGLGVPLPKGRIRINKADGDELEFIGEDRIDHTPRNEEITLTLGNAFDVKAKRVQKDYKHSQRSKIITETYEIEISNHKDDAVSVKVVENLARSSNWKITRASDNYDKKTSSQIVFEVDIPAEHKRTVTYTVEYRY